MGHFAFFGALSCIYRIFKVYSPIPAIYGCRTDRKNRLQPISASWAIYWAGRYRGTVVTSIKWSEMWSKQLFLLNNKCFIANRQYAAFQIQAMMIDSVDKVCSIGWGANVSFLRSREAINPFFVDPPLRSLTRMAMRNFDCFFWASPQFSPERKMIVQKLFLRGGFDREEYGRYSRRKKISWRNKGQARACDVGEHPGSASVSHCADPIICL